MHPNWYRVMAIVKTSRGLAHDFVAEAPTAAEAIGEASRYPFRAIVTNLHSRREFDNWKSIEIGEVA